MEGGDFVFGYPELFQRGEVRDVCDFADAVGAEFEVTELGQVFEAVDFGDFVGDEEDVGEVC